MYKDNIDKDLEKLFNEDNNIPESIKRKKELAFSQIMKMEEDKNRGKVKMKRKSLKAAAVLVAVLAIGVPTVASIKGLLFGGEYKGIQTAVENGYEQNVEGVFAEDKGIKVDLIHAVSDPTAITLRFKISADKESTLKSLGLSNENKGQVAFNIVDDKGRVIEGYDPKEGSYTVPVVDENGKETWLTGFGDSNVDLSNIKNGEVYYDYMIGSTEGNLKDIKGLSIEAVKIGALTGNWKMDLEFKEEMITEVIQSYSKFEKNDKVEVFGAKQMATGLMIDFAIEPGLDENIILQGKIEDMDGNRYGTERAGSMEVMEDGRDKVVMTFEISKFDSLEEFYFVVENFKGEELKVKVSK